jgi:hypothetical protein
LSVFRSLTSAGWNGRRGNSSGGDGGSSGDDDEQRAARNPRRRVGHARSEGWILGLGSRRFGADGESRRRRVEAAMDGRRGSEVWQGGDR